MGLKCPSLAPALAAPTPHLYLSGAPAPAAAATDDDDDDVAPADADADAACLCLPRRHCWPRACRSTRSCSCASSQRPRACTACAQSTPQSRCVCVAERHANNALHVNSAATEQAACMQVKDKQPCSCTWLWLTDLQLITSEIESHVEEGYTVIPGEQIQCTRTCWLDLPVVTLCGTC